MVQTKTMAEGSVRGIAAVVVAGAWNGAYISGSRFHACGADSALYGPPHAHCNYGWRNIFYPGRPSSLRIEEKQGSVGCRLFCGGAAAGGAGALPAYSGSGIPDAFYADVWMDERFCRHTDVSV